MGRYVEGHDRTQSVLFRERLDDWIHVDSTVHVIDVFVDELCLRKLGFESADPAATGRPGYSPATLLKIYVYGYLNRVQSSRRLETEAQRNLELIWLTGDWPPTSRPSPTSAATTSRASFVACLAIRVNAGDLV
jgi:transposase